MNDFFTEPEDGEFELTPHSDPKGIPYAGNEPEDDQLIAREFRIKRSGKMFQVVDQYENIFSYHSDYDGAEMTMDAMKAPPPGHPFYGNQWIQFAGWNRGSFGSLSTYTNQHPQLLPGLYAPTSPVRQIATPGGAQTISRGAMAQGAGMGATATTTPAPARAPAPTPAPAPAPAPARAPAPVTGTVAPLEATATPEMVSAVGAKITRTDAGTAGVTYNVTTVSGKQVTVDTAGWTGKENTFNPSMNQTQMHANRAQIQNTINNLGLDMTPEGASRMFDYTDGNLSIKMRNMSANTRTLELRGDTFNAQGQIVGHITRTISLTNGKPTISNDLWAIDEAYQGSGFGSKFYRAQEIRGFTAGVKQVVVHANIKVGGYSWARMGFTMNMAHSANTARDNIFNEWQNTNRKTGTNHPFPLNQNKKYNSWQLASVTHPTDTKATRSVANRAMKGTNWYGTKSLDITDMGFNAGLEYYATK